MRSLSLAYVTVVSILCLLLSTQTQADEQALLNTQLELFETLCIDESGAINTNLYHQSDEQVFSCADAATQLRQKIYSIEASENGCRGASLTPPDALTLQLHSVLEESEKCPKKTELLSMTCLKEISCNSFRSLSPFLLRAISNTAQTLGKKSTLPNCLDPTKKSDCYTELLNGIFQNLWGTVKAVGDIAIWIKNKVVNSWRSFWAYEDSTSNAALASSFTSESSLKQFMSDPTGYMYKIAQGVIQMIDHAIREEFGCEKWSGEPHFSKCLEPMSGWDCATCDQRMNAICGVAGFLTGEIVVAYFTGGGTTLAKSALKSSGTVSKISKFLKATGLTKLASGTVKIGKMILKTRPVLALRRLGTAIASSKLVKASLKIWNSKYNPIHRYFELMDDAYRSGDRAAQTFLANSRSRKLAQVTTIETMLPHNSPEDITRFNDELNIKGFHTRTVKTNGQTTIHVQLPKRCGGGNWIIR